MANTWFRLYHEFADDPKVQMMPEAMQRRLIMLFCSRCKEEKLSDEQRAFAWRISLADLKETKALFVSQGFCNETWQCFNWNKRQFLSDSSTDRVRRYRSKQKQDETLQKQDETGPVTAPEQIQSRTDTETEHKKPSVSSDKSPSTEPAIGALPCVGKGGKTWLFTASKVAEWSEAYPRLDVLAELRKAKQWLVDNREKQKTHRGMGKFVNGWLSRAQDRPGGNTNGNHAQPKTSGNRAVLAEFLRHDAATQSDSLHADDYGRVLQPAATNGHDLELLHHAGGPGSAGAGNGIQPGAARGVVLPPAGKNPGFSW